MKIKLNTVVDVKEFVKICESFKDSSIDVKQGRWIIDGKSILGVFSLDLIRNLKVIIDSEEDDCKMDFYESIKRWKIDDMPDLLM